jgi:hypothetical protein
VSPDVPTWYHVRLTDAIGCFSDDSVFVDVKDKNMLQFGINYLTKYLYYGKYGVKSEAEKNGIFTPSYDC